MCYTFRHCSAGSLTHRLLVNKTAAIASRSCFRTSKRRFLTNRIRNRIRSCYFIFRNSVPINTALDTSSPRFSFNVSCFLNEDRNRYYKRWGGGGGTGEGQGVGKVGGTHRGGTLKSSSQFHHLQPAIASCFVISVTEKRLQTAKPSLPPQSPLEAQPIKSRS